jgi:hypothetical protein
VLIHPLDKIGHHPRIQGSVSLTADDIHVELFHWLIMSGSPLSRG